IAAVFVLGAGIQESGVAAALARQVERAAGKSEVRILTLVCTTVIMLSAFMSNAATVAVLLPVVVALARRARIAASRLLMPLGFAAILGGNLTLIGSSSNLLVSDFLRRTTGAGLGMFEFAVIGLPICVAGVLYLLLVGRRFLPVRNDSRGPGSGPVHSEQLVDDYGLASSITHVRVGKVSNLRGSTLAETGVGRDYAVSVLAVKRRGPFGERWVHPGPDFRFERGDDVYLEGPDAEILRLAEETHSWKGRPGEHAAERVLDHGVGIAEASVPPRSDFAGCTLQEVEFRSRYGLNVLSLWREGGPVQQDFARTPLIAGDVLLLAGPADDLRRFRGSRDLVLLSAPEDARDFRKAPLALLCLAVALLPPLFGWAPLAMSALAGALLMVLTGCLPADQAGRFVEWRVLALIIGTIPLGIALESHGVADLVADTMVGASSWVGAPAVLAGLFLLAALISVTSSNAAAAVILWPVAVKAAEPLGLTPSAALLTVAYGCSCAYVVPFAHQCNLMVAKPGGYTTRDFVVVGSGLSVVVAVVAVTMSTLLG
ncbi:MAG: hypothetical protein MK209_08185, partial [Planctomycetes bacterium]|nr:hypothetical protein [Planctomycetota bacterium]